MKKNGVKYGNLRAEMGRRNITICDIARTMGMNRDTLSRKLSGKSPLFLNEAFAIQKSLFPTMDIKKLFE